MENLKSHGILSSMPGKHGKSVFALEILDSTSIVFTPIAPINFVTNFRFLRSKFVLLCLFEIIFFNLNHETPYHYHYFAEKIQLYAQFSVVVVSVFHKNT